MVLLLFKELSCGYWGLWGKKKEKRKKILTPPSSTAVCTSCFVFSSSHTPFYDFGAFKSCNVSTWHWENSERTESSQGCLKTLQSSSAAGQGYLAALFSSVSLWSLFTRENSASRCHIWFSSEGVPAFIFFSFPRSKEKEKAQTYGCPEGPLHGSWPKLHIQSVAEY